MHQTEQDIETVTSDEIVARIDDRVSPSKDRAAKIMTHKVCFQCSESLLFDVIPGVDLSLADVLTSET